jgi:amino-acid N-acetyltransferase
MTQQTTPSPVIIRQATAADLDAVEALLTTSDLPTVGVRANIADFLVAQAGTDVVGVVGMEYCGDDGLLRSTVVASARRGEGVAGMLVRQMLAHADARGVRALYLLTTTAEEYFPRFGFMRVPRSDIPRDVLNTDEFRDACPASAVAMARLPVMG